MARLNPYLGQSLEEIIPNADAILSFVSHGIRYDGKSASFFESRFILWYDVGVGRIRDQRSGIKEI